MNVVPDSVDDFEALTEDRGVLKKVISPGKVGLSPVEGDNIVMLYCGKYFGGDKDGENIHSCKGPKERLSFRIGKSLVLEGWNIALPTMQMGEICHLVLTPQYGYQGKSSCFFEIELLDFYGDDLNLSNRGSVFLTRLERGNIGVPVRPGAQCKISVQEYSSEKFIAERNINYVVGDYECNDLPRGFDFALTYMYEGEKGRIKLARNMTYPEEWYANHTIPAGSALYFVTEVISCEQRKTPSAFKTFKEKMLNIDVWKAKANQYFMDGKYKIAADMYSDLLDDITGIIASNFPEQHDLQRCKCVMYQNRAMAYLKMRCPAECLEECAKCLQIDPKNEKCLYRKGEAYLLLGDHEEAEKCFRAILQNGPNKAASDKVKFCQAVISQQLKKEREMFKTAFEQLAEAKTTTDDFTANAIDRQAEQAQAS
ncbi:hypothetical protein Aperf_G00000132926 [Anoplocephala perfoliata]